MENSSNFSTIEYYIIEPNYDQIRQWINNENIGLQFFRHFCILIEEEAGEMLQNFKKNLKGFHLGRSKLGKYRL
jgi:hypothetical protein